MRRRAMRAISAATIVSLLLAMAAAGSAAAADPSATSESARAKAEKAQHDKTVAYWTAERIANANPRDFERSTNGQIVPKARPAPPSGGGSTGASWTLEGPVAQRTGKVLFTMAATTSVPPPSSRSRRPAAPTR